MATPKRTDKAAHRRKKSITNTKEMIMTDKSKYLAMKYDYDNGSLSQYKIDEYLRLKEIFEGK